MNAVQPPSDLDGLCSRHFTWRELIHCGATWTRLATEARASGAPPPDNTPQQPGTYAAIRTLCETILDPIADRYGPERVRLTYGHAGPALIRHVRERRAPALDQHAGHELNRRGNLICPRLGQAADLHVVDEPTDALCDFVIAELPFDRIYFYGADRPLHVSVGPEAARQVVDMVESDPRGRLVPRVRRRGAGGARG